MVLSPFKQSLDCADVLLPVAPFTETAGTFINAEGRVQSFNGVVKPLGETRPAWKVLRVLGNLLGLTGFDFDSAEAVRKECVPSDLATRLGNGVTIETDSGSKPAPTNGFQRVADVPIYFADALARRAASLQLTADARAPRAWLNDADFARLGLSEGGSVKVTNGSGACTLAAARDAKLPSGCVRIAGGHISTINAGPLSGTVSVERA